MPGRFRKGSGETLAQEAGGENENSGNAGEGEVDQTLPAISVVKPVKQSSME